MTCVGQVGPPVAFLQPLIVEHPKWGAVVFTGDPIATLPQIIQWSAGRQFLRHALTDGKSERRQPGQAPAQGMDHYAGVSMQVASLGEATKGQAPGARNGSFMPVIGNAHDRNAWRNCLAR